MYAQCFDELIRQVTINCAERGLLLLRVRDALRGFDGDVLVLYGDSPFLKADTMKAMIDALSAPSNPAVVVLGFEAPLPNPYGRLIVDGQGHLTRIVNVRDANESERAVTLCNSGMMAGDRATVHDVGNEHREQSAERCGRDT